MVSSVSGFRSLFYFFPLVGFSHGTQEEMARAKAPATIFTREGFVDVSYTFSYFFGCHRPGESLGYAAEVSHIFRELSLMASEPQKRALYLAKTCPHGRFS